MCPLSRYVQHIQWRERQILPGLIICGRNLTRWRYASETVFMTDIEGKLQDILDRLTEESERKKTNHRLWETRMYTCEQNEKPKMRTMNCMTLILNKYKRLNIWEMFWHGMKNATPKIRTSIWFAKETFQKPSKIKKNPENQKIKTKKEKC